jgi:hypothetical protein
MPPNQTSIFLETYENIWTEAELVGPEPNEEESDDPDTPAN